MKKVLLSALALGMAYYASAQGISDFGAYDNFATTTEYSVQSPAGSGVYKGIFWWKKEAGGLDFTTTRSGNGVLVVEIHQADKAYEPFGVGFGKDATEQPFTLDLSGDAVVSFNLKNTSDATIEVKVGLQDIHGRTLAFDKALAENPLTFGGTDAQLYQYEIGATSTGNYGPSNGENSVEAGGSLEFSYDFKNALAAEYVFNANDPYECNNLAQWQEDCDGGTCFDYSKVTAVTFTVVNASNGAYGSPAECWSKEAFNGTIELSEVVIGTKVTGLFGAKASASNVNVYPNPASDYVTFGKTLTNGAVYNAQGMVVDTFTSAEGLNVSSYADGVYFINATEGAARIIVK